VFIPLGPIQGISDRKSHQITELDDLAHLLGIDLFHGIAGLMKIPVSLGVETD
jgi:hypothetical protein